jgi:uncharacterized protein YndB with AHSA1/START domain
MSPRLVESHAMQRVIVDRHFELPPERVFAYLSEHENLGAIFGAAITRVRDGEGGERNGVGSVRRLKIGPLPAFEETVTEFVAPELIRYQITKGSPLRDHSGELRFSPSGTGTRLYYEIAFGTIVPGLDRVIAASLRRSVATGLADVDAKA